MRIPCRNTSAWIRADGARPVLYSYDTPVAVRDAGGWVKSSRRYSVTTSKQTRQFAPGAREVPHAEFVALLPEEDRSHGRRFGRLED